MSLEQLEQQLGDDPVIIKAYQFAKNAHAGQKRKLTNEPYIIHPLRMAVLCSHYTQNSHIIVAALLHDTVEDTDVTLEQIKTEFGDYVHDLVNPLTEKDKSMEWEYRRELARNELLSASHDAMLIKCADKIDNMGDIRDCLKDNTCENPWQHFKRGPEVKIPEWEKVYEIIEEKYPNCPLLPSFRNILDEIHQLVSI